MKAAVKDGKLIIELPLAEVRPSGTGKMDLLVTSGGFADVLNVKGETLAIGDKPLRANVTAGFFVGEEKPTPVSSDVKAVVDTPKGVLRIAMPMSAEGIPSSTGKMLLHAGTRGWINTGVLVGGRSLRLNATVGTRA